MTNFELKQKFEDAGKSAHDFIKWVKEKGVKVHAATISRHLAGTQGITQPWELAYLWFFHDMPAAVPSLYRIHLDNLIAASEGYERHADFAFKFMGHVFFTTWETAAKYGGALNVEEWSGEG